MIGITFIFLWLAILTTHVNVPLKYKGPRPSWYVRKHYEVAKSKLKPDYLTQSAKSNYWHGRMVAYEHDTAVVMAGVFLLAGVMFALMLNNYYTIAMGLTLIPIVGMAGGIQPKEILGTGFVDASDEAFGATNNSTKLNAAITYANANDKRRIYLGNVDWSIASKIEIPHSSEDWILEGYTKEITVLTSTINGDNVFETQYSAPNRVINITLSNFSIVGGGSEYAGLHLYYSSNIYIEQVKVSGCGRSGLYLQNIYGGYIIGAEFSSNSVVYGYYDARLDSSNNLSIIDTICRNGSYCGLVLNGSNNCSVIGCTAEGEGNVGIAIRSNSRNNTIISTYIENNGDYGFLLYGADVATPIRGNNIVYNYINGSSNSDYGILQYWANDTKIHFNTFRENNTCSIQDGYSTRPNYGTEITFNFVEDTSFLITTAYSYSCYIGNQTFNGTTTGCTISGDNTRIVKNNFTGCTTGVYLNSESNNTEITGNDFTGVTTPIYNLGTNTIRLNNIGDREEIFIEDDMFNPVPSGGVIFSESSWDYTATGTMVKEDRLGGGILSTTGATTGNSNVVNTGTAFPIHVSDFPATIFEVKPDSVTAHEIEIGWYNDANNYILFTSDDNGNIYARCKNTGTETAVDTGVAQTTDARFYKIELIDDGSVNFYLSTTSIENMTFETNISTNIPTTGTFLQHRIYHETTEDVAKGLTVGMIHHRQVR